MFAALREFLNPLAWFLSLGKGDTDNIKGEIQDLLQHSSASLKSLLELSDVLEPIPQPEFTKERFWPIANHCLAFFASPEAAHQARTHCTDIRRDVARINFTMAKILRTENLDWKGINNAFQNLIDADQSFLTEYADELTRIGDELNAIGKLLDGGNADAAWRKYDALRASLHGSKQALTNEIARMQNAHAHVHELLT